MEQPDLLELSGKKRAWSALGAPDVVTWRDVTWRPPCPRVTWRDVTRRPPCPRRRLTSWRDVTWRHPCPRRRLWCPDVTWRDVTASLSTAAPVTSWRDVTWRDVTASLSTAAPVTSWRDVTWRDAPCPRQLLHVTVTRRPVNVNNLPRYCMTSWCEVCTEAVHCV